MAKLNEIIVLFNGYSKIDAEFPNHFLTNCTCTLIKGRDGYNIIVDTMTPWDGAKILEAPRSYLAIPKINDQLLKFQMAKLNEIIVLFNGYSKIDAEFPNHFLTNCTCTLIKGRDGYNIIVDTMTPWDGAKILEALKKNSIEPDHISAVVSTHGHSDHTGNNNLFLKAKWHIVGQSIMDKDKYLIHDPWTPFELTPDIRVIDTPGHTLSCVSVVVNNSNLGTAVLTGDLFEKKEDVNNQELWQEVGSEDKAAQAENRFKVANMADWIIPGHGEPFPVTQEIREKLHSQIKNN